jgi:hypothetical protein
MQNTVQISRTDTSYALSPGAGLRYGECYIYLNFILLLLARVLDSVTTFQLNLSQILLGVSTLLFLPFFRLIAKGRVNKLNTMGYLVILAAAFSPIFYLFLDMVDDSRSISSHFALDKFISYSSYSVHTLAIYVCISSLNVKIWKKINKCIFFVGIAISIEAIVFYLIFPNFIAAEWIAPKGKFVSLLIRDNVLCGIIATIFYIQSIILYRLRQPKSSFKFFLCGLLAISLLLAAGERSTILAFIVLNLLVFVLAKKGNLKMPVSNGFILIMLLITLGAVQFNVGRETSYFDSESGIDRLVIGSVGVKTAIDFFPLGAGGNMSSAYFGKNASNSQLFNAFQESLPTDFRNQFELFRSIRSGEEKGRVSWHNSYLELVSDIGIVGVIICLALVYFWFKYYSLLKCCLKRNEGNPKAMEPILWLSFYFFILISFFFTSHNSYYWVFGFYLFGSLLVVKRYVQSQPVPDFLKMA